MDEIIVIPERLRPRIGKPSSLARPPKRFKIASTLEILNSETKTAVSFAPFRYAYNYRLVAIILSIYLSAGVLCFSLVRHQISGKKTNKILDALYITIVSMTSVGYGDLSPQTALSILLVCLFAIVGMLLFGLVISKAADYIIEKQELLMTKTVGIETLQKEVKSNKIRNKFIMLFFLLVVLMAVGTTVLVFVEDLDVTHAFYCINATITSVGSDRCFSTNGGRVFALFWIVFGTIYVGQVFFTFNELYSQRRQRSLRNKVLKRKTTISDLKAADIDQDGVLKISEYVLHKLKEMRTINEDDITLILNEFEKLSSNNTGVILKSGAHGAAMASNRGNQASSMEKPSLTIIPEIRLSRTNNNNPTTAVPMASNNRNDQASPTEQPPTFSFCDAARMGALNLYKAYLMLVIYWAAGTICFYIFRHQISGKKTNGILDAFYFTMVLMSSVGYGDLAPDSNLAILFASLFAFLGTVLVGIFLSIGANSLIMQQEITREMDLNEELQMDADEKIRTKKEFESIMMRIKFILLAFYLAVHIGAGTGILVSVEDSDFIHAFYCVIATITSVSSDKCFSTKGGRAFALLWIYMGINVKSQVLSIFTELQTQRRQRSLVKEVLERKTTIEDLHTADLDHDGVVVAAEYIIFKLKELGKISQEDITLIMDEFQRLDVNNKDELTQPDIGS